MFRNQRHPLLDVFDTPDGYFSVSERNVTTTPTQALLMINGPWVLDRARALAKRLEREAGPNEQQRVEHAYELVYGRTPDAEEVVGGVEFLKRQAEKVDRPKPLPRRTAHENDGVPQQRSGRVRAGRQAVAAAGE